MRLPFLFDLTALREIRPDAEASPASLPRLTAPIQIFPYQDVGIG